MEVNIVGAVILPCPFCGQKPKILAGGNEYDQEPDHKMGYWLECSGCCCEVGNDSVGLIDGYSRGVFDSVDEAVDAWNRRIVV